MECVLLLNIAIVMNGVLVVLAKNGSPVLIYTTTYINMIANMGYSLAVGYISLGLTLEVTYA